MKRIRIILAALGSIFSVTSVHCGHVRLAARFTNATTTPSQSTATGAVSNAAFTSAQAAALASSKPKTELLSTSRDLLEVWGSCESRYTSFLKASGTRSLIPSTATGAITIDTSLDSYSFEYTITTTVVPTPYTPPLECYTGCEMYAPEVRLNYWPTPRVNGTITSRPTATQQPMASVVVDGSTFVSPSNYVVFTDIRAFKCPVDGSPCTQLGTTVHETTLAFGQNELATQNCYHRTSLINYEDFNTPVPWSIISQQVGCTLLRTSYPGSQVDYEYTMHPDFVLPAGVKTRINPDWANCTVILPAGDPPSALTPAKSFTNGITSTTKPVQQYTTAPAAADPPPAPHSTPLPPGPIPTQHPPAPADLPNPGQTQNPSPPPVDPGHSSPDPQEPRPGESNPDPGYGGGSQSLGAIIAGFIGASAPAQGVPGAGSTITLPGLNTDSSDDPYGQVVTTVAGHPITLAPQPMTTMVGGQTVTISPDGSWIMVNGVKVTCCGASPITVNGIVLSLGPSGMVVGSSTVAFAKSAKDPTFSMAPDGSWVVIDGQTLSLGGSAVTVSGKVMSLGSSGLVFGSSTVPFGSITKDGTLSKTGINIGPEATGFSANGSLQASSAGLSVYVRGCKYLFAFTAWLIWSGI